MMKCLFSSFLMLFLLMSSCSRTPKSWKYSHNIALGKVNPIGITATEEGLWLSDGDHNRLVLINEKGTIVQEVNEFDRPMHIDQKDNVIYVPEYGSDQLIVLREGIKNNYQLKDSLDAPAAVSVFNDEIAIVDFYKHRILYNNGSEWISFGKEGSAKGYFYFPTDVQITKDKIFVADAYNNRIQTFDKTGKFLSVFGADQKMNAATGMYVSDKELFVTDFENNRVLIFDFEGNLKQELKEGIHKPIDAFVDNEKLYINNFRKGVLSIFNYN